MSSSAGPVTTTPLSNAFHGYVSPGEGNYPGSGGNLNAVYAGAGYYNEHPEDLGYAMGQFPAGGLASGAETQEFRISDSDAFNNLRGIAKTAYPFDPFPVQDHPNLKTSALADNFAQPELAGVSSLLPGRYSYNTRAGTLSQSILDEFAAGASTFNSLPTAETNWGSSNFDGARRNYAAGTGLNGQVGEGIEADSIVEQFKTAFVTRDAGDVPLTPFHKTYPNFGSGTVDYGFAEPGADAASADILRAYHAILPEGQLAGTKKELMPVFSGINQEAVEQRPILQSLGKQKNTLYLGGLTELPDDLRIDPREALLSGSNIPADLVQTAGELASALDTLGWSGDGNSLRSSDPWGPRMPDSRMLTNPDVSMPADFYEPTGEGATEPLLFDSGPNIYAFNETGTTYA
jgi:hypothetical protein